MFFYIGEHKDDLLTKVHDRLYLDKGWKYKEHLWYKGYSTECILENNLDKIVKGYTPNGIWCVIEYDGAYKIHHSSLRGFPLYKKEDQLTNLKYQNFSSIDKPINYIDNTATYEQVINDIFSALIVNCKNYSKFYTSDIDIWCTGGIDSLSIVAIYEYLKLPYKIYIARPRKYKSNLRDFEGSITEYNSALSEKLQNDYWGYEIASTFIKPKTIATGFYGDEFVCRGPYQLNYMANVLGKTILDLVQKEDYMYPYLQKSNIKQTFLLEGMEEVDAKTKVKTGLSLDYQIWHLNDTITFCPYYDERIIDSVLSLPAKEIVLKTLDATIQKDVIRKCSPELLVFLDKQKNTELGRINFITGMRKVKLKFCQKIQIV